MESIFTVERRKDLRDAYDTFWGDLNSIIKTSSYDTYPLIKYLNWCIRYWPYRCGAVSIDNYLEDIEVDYPWPKDDKDRLYSLELIINLLHFAPIQDQHELKLKGGKNIPSGTTVRLESERLIKNAEYILEQCCNMKVRTEFHDECSKYFITKRSAQVDAAIIAVPELKDVLLSYFDLRNQGNTEQKKAILIAVHNYMEPHKKEYKSLACSAISEEFFASINKLGIRHNAESQIQLDPEKANDVFDKLFLMAVYVLQTSQVNKYKDELIKLRETKI